MLWHDRKGKIYACKLTKEKAPKTYADFYLMLWFGCLYVNSYGKLC